jgi:cytochrome b561
LEAAELEEHIPVAPQEQAVAILFLVQLLLPVAGMALRMLGRRETVVLGVAQETVVGQRLEMVTPHQFLHRKVTMVAQPEAA